MSVIERVIDRMKPGEDIGLDNVGQEDGQRSINPTAFIMLENRSGKL